MHVGLRFATFVATLELPQSPSILLSVGTWIVPALGCCVFCGFEHCRTCRLVDVFTSPRSTYTTERNCWVTRYVYVQLQ